MRIFLSYGHDDYASLALRIKRDLELQGHKVWFDIERLVPGRDWQQYIEDGIDWASAVPGEGRFLLLLTPHSVRRPDGYCLNELVRALGRNLPIIAVMLSTVEPPLSICRLQWLDMRNCFPPEEHGVQYTKHLEQLVEALIEKQLPFEGVQQRLLNYLNPLSYDDLTKHLFRFTGREWVMREVDAWLASSRRVLWITGEAGVGKSALAAWLCDKRPEIAAYHFCRVGNSDRVDAGKVLFSLAYQLSTQLPVYQDRLNASPLDETVNETNLPAVFDRLFVTLLNDAVPLADKPQVLLIDALDEATRNGRNELALLIGGEFDRLPSWLRLIVTSRPHEQGINSELQVHDPWKLDAGRAENLQDIRKYLYRELRPFAGQGTPSDKVVTEIVDKSEGLFLYASLVREELEKGRLSLARLEEFPQGLGGVFFKYFHRQFPDLEQFRREVRPALRAILAAREPLPLEILQRLFGWCDEELRDFTGSLGSLFPIAIEGGHAVIKAYHKSLADYLVDDSRAGVYFVSLTEGHRELAKAGLNDFYTNKCLLPYFKENLMYHLFDIKDWDHIRQLASDDAFLKESSGSIRQCVPTLLKAAPSTCRVEELLLVPGRYVEICRSLQISEYIPETLIPALALDTIMTRPDGKRRFKEDFIETVTQILLFYSRALEISLEMASDLRYGTARLRSLLDDSRSLLHMAQSVWDRDLEEVSGTLANLSGLTQFLWNKGSEFLKVEGNAFGPS